MIDKLHLKVELDSRDMNLFSINRASFIEKDNKARLVLKSILKNAYEKTGFDIFNSKLLVEIFPTTGDGCIMLFTKAVPKSNRRFKVSALQKPKVFEFSNADNLLDCAKNLSNHTKLGENRLYEYQNKYYLVFLQNLKIDKHSALVLSEFSNKVSKFSIEFLNEHAKLLCKKDALSHLGVAQ